MKPILIHQYVLYLMLTLFMLLPAPSMADSDNATVPYPYNEAWKRAVQALELQGATVTSHDKEMGIIRAEGTFNYGDGLFHCPKLRGSVVEKQSYTITVVIRSDGEKKSMINISAIAEVERYRQHHLFGIKGIPTSGKHRTTTQCYSTGNLEDSILQQINKL